MDIRVADVLDRSWMLAWAISLGDFGGALGRAFRSPGSCLTVCGWVGLSREHHCESEVPPAPVTPEAPKEVEVPQAGLRGKRSSRAKTKAIVQPKWQQSHVLTSNDHTSSSSSSSEAETPSSGRPCRRTAGRHSGFENYVLLMRSR